MEYLRIYAASFLLLWLTVLARSCGKCGIGKCVNSRCLCPSGFWGKNCELGWQRLTKRTGFLSDYALDYVPLSKMSWFIDSQRKNTSIEFKLESFATECAWDHMYIYDGLSIYDPLIAALSGKISQLGVFANSSARRKIIARSGAALVHFFSDKHLNDEGFNITYRISNCSNETCSGRGFCNSLNVCECEDNWTGKDCSIRECCPYKLYNLASNTYNCPGFLIGSGCPSLVAGRASHASVIQDNIMWVYGGYSFDNKSNNILSYNVITKAWSTVDSSPPLESRFGHTIIYYDKKLYIFGGIKTVGEITNELWEFNTQTKVWRELTVKGVKPIAVTGHAAVLVRNQMFVMMGYSPEGSYTDCVQQLDLGTMEWQIIETKGALITGTFGHSAVYDRATDLVFIYGGYSFPVDSISPKKIVSNSLFSFNPTTKYWKVLPSSNHARLLHSSVIIGRLLVIYGGANHHHMEIKETEKQCYSNDILVYNIDCNNWKKIASNRLFSSLGRFGHSAVQYNRTMYVFGGFDGQPRNDVIPVTIGNCSGYATRTKCLQAPFVANCVWNKASSRCLEAENSILLPKSQIESPPCNATVVECRSFQACKTCLSNTKSCAWCDGSCSDAKCANVSGVKAVSDVNVCPASIKFTCSSLSTCYSCELHPKCAWAMGGARGTCKVAESKSSRNVSVVCNPEQPSEAQCYNIKSCSRCTNAHKIGCMWCESQKMCIDSEAYFVNFPYGQCLEWLNTKSCPDVKCSSRNTCQGCFGQPGCGWCGDSRGTGIGVCMDGTDRGAINGVCPASRWYYTDCPNCQCNGHSQCVNGSVCAKCENNTIGTNCESCKVGYHGLALYNGKCTKCFCNGHGLDCDSQTGVCTCDTAGLIGKNCDRCDYRHYIGNATDGGHCFYHLLFGYQYNFNRTKKNRNFFAIPTVNGKSMKFEIVVRQGDRAYLNFSYTQNGIERFIVRKYPLGAFGKTFSADSYKIVENQEPIFKIYIYNISKNAVFQISFEQGGINQLNWLHFLIVFLICFCSLLIILIVVWKLKQQYSNYQFNRRRRVELHEMASRPFACIKLCCDSSSRRRRIVEPAQIGLEPFAHSHVAVASILVKLPRSETGFSPKGQSGLCIGSTVVQHRHQNLIANAQHQLCMFKERQKRHRHTPVNV